ncbi:MAG: hypothetical protein ACFB3T_13835 [Geminicoccaceae bacterium]
MAKKLKAWRRSLYKRLPFLNRMRNERRRKRSAVDEPIDLKLIFDADWYRATYRPKVTGVAETLRQFIEHGAHAGHAPCAAMTEDDGRTLALWARQVLHKHAGIAFGHAPGASLPVCGPPALDPQDLSNPDGKRLAVVTAVFGQFDHLAVVAPVFAEQADFFALSDHDVPGCAPWQLVRCPYHHIDPRRRARFVKTHLPLLFGAYDWVMWVDGNITLYRAPTALLDDAEPDTFDLASFCHPLRHNALDEAMECLRMGKDDPALLLRQLQRLPKQYGDAPPFLLETNVIFLRTGHAGVQRVCRTWWSELQQGSRRDQLVLPFLLNAMPDVRWRYLPGGCARDSVHYHLVRHQR